MNPQPLHRPYIGITLYVDDYAKVQNLLPTPSYTDTLQAYNYQKIILIYAIEGYITSHSQYYWISNIKLGLQKSLCVPFEYEENFTITEHTEATSLLYDIKTLSMAFRATIIQYPKIMYPPTKKELYRQVCRYGTRLVHQKCFTKEAMTATALLMNAKLKDKYSIKDLHKKALGAYSFIDKNKEAFRVGLDEVELKKAHSKGGQIRKAQIVKTNKEKVQHFLKSGNYIKPNGKANLTLLAEVTGIDRKTVAKYV